jgi:hypothetical protein
MASSEELLISKSMIFRSVRALRAASLGPSDLPGLSGGGGYVSVEVVDPSLKMRGRRVGICSDITGAVLSPR